MKPADLNTVQQLHSPPYSYAFTVLFMMASAINCIDPITLETS